MENMLSSIYLEGEATSIRTFSWLQYDEYIIISSNCYTFLSGGNTVCLLAKNKIPTFRAGFTLPMDIFKKSVHSSQTKIGKTLKSLLGQ
jgi:hypothetical protein